MERLFRDGPGDEAGRPWPKLWKVVIFILIFLFSLVNVYKLSMTDNSRVNGKDISPIISDLGVKIAGVFGSAKEVKKQNKTLANGFRPVPSPPDEKLLAEVRGSDLIRKLRECKTNDGELFYMVGWARSSKDTFCDEGLHFPIGNILDSRLLCPGQHSIDIGANFGDTTVPMAFSAARGGGRTVAFEPYTAAFKVLDWLSKLNQGLLIDPYQFPIDVQNRDWWGMSDSKFYSNANKRQKGAGQKWAARELLSFLGETYGEAFIRKVGFIKVDVETESINVLESFLPLIRDYVKPVIVVEWFQPDRKRSCSSGNNVRLFNVIRKLGYVAYTTVFQPGQFKIISECTAEFKQTQPDLLLYPEGTVPNAVGGIKSCSD